MLEHQLELTAEHAAPVALRAHLPDLLVETLDLRVEERHQACGGEHLGTASVPIHDVARDESRLLDRFDIR